LKTIETREKNKKKNPKKTNKGGKETYLQWQPSRWQPTWWKWGFTTRNSEANTSLLAIVTMTWKQQINQRKNKSLRGKEKKEGKMKAWGKMEARKKGRKKA
jgi:hypothetical protein